MGAIATVGIQFYLYGESKITRIETDEWEQKELWLVQNLYGESKITRIETRSQQRKAQRKKAFIWRIQDNKD